MNEIIKARVDSYIESMNYHVKLANFLCHTSGICLLIIH